MAQGVCAVERGLDAASAPTGAPGRPRAWRLVLTLALLSLARSTLGAPGVVDLQAVGLREGTLIHIAPGVAVTGQAFALDLPIEGVTRRVELHPYSIRGIRFRLLEHDATGDHEIDPGPARTVRGAVAGVPGSRAAGGITDDGVCLAIDLPADAEHPARTWWIEPIAGRIPGMASGTHVVYAAPDVGSHGERCGAAGGGGTARGSPFGARSSTTYYAQAAVEADFEYFALLGSTSLVGQRIELVYNVIDLQYERDVGVSFLLSAVVVNTSVNDPYTQNDAGGMLGEMIAYWNANRAWITRDLAHLFTGKSTGPVIGTALLGTVCTANAYAVSRIEFNAGNLASACDLVAHETGHNFSACHCACASPAFTMNPVILGINRFGNAPDDCDTGSIAAIVAHRNSSACLDPAIAGADPPRNDACAAAAVIGPGTWGFSNAGATTDGPSGACAPLGADVWYRYTSDRDGWAVVNTCGTKDYTGPGATGLDSAVAIYTGACGALSLLACADGNTGNCNETPPFRDAFVTFPIARGTTYLIRVGGVDGATGAGSLKLWITPCTAPANDACTNATPIADGAFPFSTVCATTDGTIDDAPGCASRGYSQTGSDIWFRYTPGCSGTATASICGPDRTFDTRLAVYGPACPASINQAIACDDNGCSSMGVPGGSRVSWPVSAGSTYLIRVGGFEGQRGTGTLVVGASACPADIDDGSFTGTRDCGVDINDFLYFLWCFASGGSCADLDDNGIDPPLPDGGVDINDLLYFMLHFESGC